jgi:integrase
MNPQTAVYGNGLRLNEGLNLRVKDIDLGHKQILVRDAKGNESRATMLSEILIDPLQAHLQKVHDRHQQDLNAGYGSVFLT